MSGSTRGHFPKVLVNHVGFHPRAGKSVVVDGVSGAESFRIFNMRQRGGEPSFAAGLVPGGPDLGSFLVGDFSEFEQPGTYRVSVVGKYAAISKQGAVDCWSHDFRIGADVWDDVIAALVHYYRVQSCGPSEYGYNTPCHTGDIRRDDGGQARPLVGGWHSAHDCSRTAAETLYGAFGLIGLASARPDLARELNVHHELRWGNDLFLETQDPMGYLYEGVYSPVYMQFMDYDWWDSGSYLLQTRPAARYLQHSFASIQAQIYLLLAESDGEYAGRCLDAGRRCFQWADESGEDTTSYDLGTGLSAAVHLFRATAEERYLGLARQKADQLLSLQASEGHFDEHPEPASAGADASWTVERACYSHQALLGLVDAARWLRDHPDRTLWLEALSRFADHYARRFAQTNAFGILPNRAFTGAPQQTSRRWPGGYYRYFMETNYWSGDESMYWQSGDIAVRAGYGTCLVHVSGILDDPELRRLAHRQLDWALGVNPFDSSMVCGIGRNQPPTYPSREMIPPVPDIRGAVYQGIGGDEEDNPLVIPGCYVTCEFWMPHQGSLLWLIAELSQC